jgi:hypothetical protein
MVIDVSISSSASFCASSVAEPQLMRYPKADTVNKRIAENERLTQKARLLALAAITRPSLWQLVRLLSNPRTPSRLLTLAAKRYETEILRRELRKL